METFGYNSYGYLSTISAGGSTRYSLTGMNAREQLTGATLGSSLSASYGFDSYGYPSSTSADTLQDYRYSFDPVTGNLNSRQNYKRSLSESFLYDDLERLTTVTGLQNLAMTYSANGNIQTKSDISSSTAFTYGTFAGPYALTGLTSSTGVIPTIQQTAAYTSFEKVDTIAEAPYIAKFKYNSDNQRARMVVTQSGSTILTRWYVDSRYMKETASGVTKEYTWLGGDAYTAPVVAVTQSGTTTYYYLLRDYLGNITHQVNTSNVVVAEYNFDAWGRRRSADDWSYTLDANDLNLVADRGFTGHEFLKYFNLYNMNGRLYDPLVGRFLNPDPYVQMPDFSQNYNRYTYCLNNPLKFTDPSGYRLAGPEYDSSIDAVNAYLGYMTDVTGAWHLTSGGGGGSRGYYFSGGNYYDRKSGVIVKWNEVYDNYVVPNSKNVTEEFVKELKKIQAYIAYNAFSSAMNIGYGLSFDDPETKTKGDAHGNNANFAADMTGKICADALNYVISLFLVPEALFAKVAGELTVAAKTSTNLLKPLGLGSTGRTVAGNLTEQLAMIEIMSNPAMGRVIKTGLKDARWSGWSKMAWNNAGVEIHYVGKFENGVLKAVDDFKFIGGQ